MENLNELRTNIDSCRLTNSIRSENQRLLVSPIPVQTARAFTAWTHRNLVAPIDAEFVFGARNDRATLVGVVFAGPPRSWIGDDGATAEILCMSTDGTPNADRVLLGAVWWAAQAKGYQRMAVSALLRAAGFLSGGGNAAEALWMVRTIGGCR
jgi:hypothetical protein